MKKALLAILGAILAGLVSCQFLLGWAVTKTPETVYELHFVSPIRQVEILGGGGISLGGGHHFLKFSAPDPVPVKHRDLFAEIPLASKAAQDGIEYLTAKFPEDRGLFSAGDDLKCLYLSNPGHHNEKWLFSQRSRPVHFFCSITK
jgi:hypothetical protein